MADPKDPPSDDPHNSFRDLDFAIGQTADGKIDSFPLSELPERQRKQAIEDNAWDAAIADSEKTPEELKADEDFQAEYEANAGTSGEEAPDE